MVRRPLLLACGVVALMPVCAQDLAEQLFAAARKGDVTAVKAFLDRGVSVNAKARYDRTALSFAAHRGHLEVVQLLLERGADPNVKDTFYGSSALALAASERHLPVVQALLNRGADGGEELLMNGVAGGRAELVKIVLEKGGVSAETLSAALVIATRNKRDEIVGMLKTAGATPPPPANFPVHVATLHRFEGLYRSDRGLEITVAVKDGKLVGDQMGRSLGELGGINNTTFRLVSNPEEVITFVLEGDEVTGFISRRGPIEFRFQKVKGN